VKITEHCCVILETENAELWHGKHIFLYSVEIAAVVDMLTGVKLKTQHLPCTHSHNLCTGNDFILPPFS